MYCSLTSSSIHLDLVLVLKQRKTAQNGNQIKNQFMHITKIYRRVSVSQLTNFLFNINIGTYMYNKKQDTNNLLLKASWATEKKMDKWQILSTLEEI